MIRRGIYKQLAEIGKIKIGMKGEERTSKNGKKFRIPTKLDYFMITTTERDKNGDFIINTDLMDKVAPKDDSGVPNYEALKELDVMLLFDDLDLNFHTEYQYYHGNRRMCHGDGIVAERTYLKDSKSEKVLPDHIVELYREGKHDEVFTVRYEKEVSGSVKAGDTRHIVCDPEKCPFAQPDEKGATRCKPSGILSVILPESMEIGGRYVFRTHSWHSVSSIMSSLEYIELLTEGILAGLQMKLKMIKKTTEDHGDVNYVTIVFDGAAHKVREAAMIEAERRKALPRNAVKMIEEVARSSKDFFNTDDDADVEGEFYATVDEAEIPIDDRAEIALENVSNDRPELVEEDEKEEPQPEEKPKQEKKSSIDDELF